MPGIGAPKPPHQSTLLFWSSARSEETADIITLLGEMFNGEDGKRCVNMISSSSKCAIIVAESNEVYLHIWTKKTAAETKLDESGAPPKPQQLIRIKLGPDGGGRDEPGPAVSSVACTAEDAYVCLQNGNVFTCRIEDALTEVPSSSGAGSDLPANCSKNQNQMTAVLATHIPRGRVLQVACGERHTLFLLQDGKVLATGDNSHGQLGTDPTGTPVNGHNALQTVADLPKVKVIACGHYHSLAITESGEVHTWGYGRACGATQGDILTPVPQRASYRTPNIVQLAGGRHHSIALAEDGSVYTWGEGQRGQLGHGKKVTFLETPKKLPGTTLPPGGITWVSAADNSSNLLTGDGKLFIVGENSQRIVAGHPTNHIFYNPYLVATGGQPVKRVTCAGTHAMAVIGKPDVPVKSGQLMGNGQEVDRREEDTTAERKETSVGTPSVDTRGWSRGLQRESTTLTLAEFYAPSPEHDVLNQTYDASSNASTGAIDSTTSRSQRRATRRSNWGSMDRPSKGPSSSGGEIEMEGVNSRRIVPNLPHIATGLKTSLVTAQDRNPEMQKKPAAKHTKRVVTEAARREDLDWKSQTAMRGGAGKKCNNSGTINPVNPEILDPENGAMDGKRSREGQVAVQEGTIDSANDFNVPFSHRLLPNGRKRHEPLGGTVQISNSRADHFVLPREKSMISSKNIDFVTLGTTGSQGGRAPPFCPLNPNLPTLSRRSGASSTTGKGNQTQPNYHNPVLAFRRTQTLHGFRPRDNAKFHHWHLVENGNLAKNDSVHNEGASKHPANEDTRLPAPPSKTVTFVTFKDIDDCDLRRSRKSNKHVSIPGLDRTNTILGCSSDSGIKQRWTSSSFPATSFSAKKTSKVGTTFSNHCSGCDSTSLGTQSAPPIIDHVGTYSQNGNGHNSDVTVSKKVKFQNGKTTTPKRKKGSEKVMPSSDLSLKSRRSSQWRWMLESEVS